VKIERSAARNFLRFPEWSRDATELLLNIKAGPIKLNTDLPKTIYVNVENPPAPGDIGQIEEDADFAVLTRACTIATVSEGGKLQI